MSQTERAYEPSAGAIYGFIGIVLIVLGGFALSNAHEADVFGTIGVGLIAGGSYATIAGAVARGINSDARASSHDSNARICRCRSGASDHAALRAATLARLW